MTDCKDREGRLTNLRSDIFKTRTQLRLLQADPHATTDSMKTIVAQVDEIERELDDLAASGEDGPAAQGADLLAVRRAAKMLNIEISAYLSCSGDIPSLGRG